MARQSPQQIVDRILAMDEGTRFMVLAPVVRGRKGEYNALLDDLAKQGSPGPGWTGSLSSSPSAASLDLARYEQHTIEVVVDRLVRRDDIRRRLTESLETALSLAEGVAEVVVVEADGTEEEAITFSQHLACTFCGLSFEDPSPRNFSFNSPYGACPACTGLGTRFEVDPELVVPDPTMSLAEGALAPWSGARGEYFTRVIAAVAEMGGFSLDTPWEKLTKANKKLVLYGAGTKRVHLTYRNRYGRKRSFDTLYEGIVPWLERRHSEAESDFLRDNLEGFLREVPCPECGGARLRPESLAVTVGGYSIFALCSLPIGTAVERRGIAGPLRSRPPDCRPGVPRGARADAVPPRRGSRLPDAGPIGGDAVGRRGAADPVGQSDRQRSGRGPLRARRALHRAASTRQQTADRHPQAAPRPREHRHRGRARRGDHPGGRPRGRRGTGGGRARRADRALRSGHRARRSRVESRVADRPVPVRGAVDRRTGPPPRRAAARC